MTLLERAKLLEERATRRRDLQLRERNASTLRARTRNLSEQLERIQRAREKAAALRGATLVVVEPDPPSTDRLTAYEADASGEAAAAFPQRSWEKVMVPIARFAAASQERLANAVASAKQALVGGVTEAQLRGYTHVPTTKDRATQLVATFLGLANRDWNAATATELEVLLRTATKFARDLKTMQEDGASEALRTFLADARSPGGASFSALTEPLRAELIERRLLGSLKVVMR